MERTMTARFTAFTRAAVTAAALAMTAAPAMATAITQPDHQLEDNLGNLFSDTGGSAVYLTDGHTNSTAHFLLELTTPLLSILNTFGIYDVNDPTQKLQVFS